MSRGHDEVGESGKVSGGGISEQKEEGEEVRSGTEDVGSDHSGPHFTLGEMGAVWLQCGELDLEVIIQVRGGPGGSSGNGKTGG